MKLISIIPGKRVYSSTSIQNTIDFAELMPINTEQAPAGEPGNEWSASRVYTNKKKDLKFLLQ